MLAHDSALTGGAVVVTGHDKPARSKKVTISSVISIPAHALPAQRLPVRHQLLAEGGHGLPKVEPGKWNVALGWWFARVGWWFASVGPDISAWALHSAVNRQSGVTPTANRWTPIRKANSSLARSMGIRQRAAVASTRMHIHAAAAAGRGSSRPQLPQGRSCYEAATSRSRVAVCITYRVLLSASVLVCFCVVSGCIGRHKLAWHMHFQSFMDTAVSRSHMQCVVRHTCALLEHGPGKGRWACMLAFHVRGFWIRMPGRHTPASKQASIDAVRPHMHSMMFYAPDSAHVIHFRPIWHVEVLLRCLVEHRNSGSYLVWPAHSTGHGSK